MPINSLEDVRPGDFMISGQNTAPNRVLVYAGQLLMRDHFRIGRFVAGHAAMITPGGKLVEAMPKGARERDLRETDWSPGHAYFRLPEDYPGQGLDAAAAARAMIDTPYSFASYAYMGAYLAGFTPEWLAKRIDRRRSPVPMDWPSFYHQDSYNEYITKLPTVEFPLEAICSVLAEQAWTLTGKTVIRGTRPQVVTPGMLTQQLWMYPGVIGGGSGITFGNGGWR